MFVRSTSVLLSLIFSLGFIFSFVGCGGQKELVKASESTPAEVELASWVQPHEAVVEKIFNQTMASNGAMKKLEELCDDIGHRISGSPELDQAIEWAVAALKADGHENVAKEPVMVPKWVRGEESLVLLSPRETKLPVLGLGMSVGTAPEGVEGEVAVVRSEDELKALGPAAAGKIILFDNAMPDYHHEHGSGYGKTVRFRVHGARMASEVGAVAILVRSVTANSLRTLHTGMMKYGDAKKKIPAAAVTTEDASMIARMVKRGKKVVVRLKMGARDEGMVPSANVVAELKGRTNPEEVVVIGGHLDSWDVGQGAHDDAAGCVMAMEALTILRSMNLVPKRTIRVVLWTNEENGLQGGKTYAKDHRDELDKHFGAIEADSGGFAPDAFGLSMADMGREARAAQQLEALLPLFAKLAPMRVKRGFAGADISPMKESGVPLLGLRTEGSRYFDYHHTPADTFDKVDPEDFSRSVAAMAAIAYILGEMPGKLGD